MQTVKLVIALVALAGVGYIVYTFLQTYLTTSGSRWDRILQSTHNSAVILWARFSTAVSLLVAALAMGADYINLPGVGDALKMWMTPQVVSLVFAGAMIVSELARRRTL